MRSGRVLRAFFIFLSAGGFSLSFCFTSGHDTEKDHQSQFFAEESSIDRSIDLDAYTTNILSND